MYGKRLTDIAYYLLEGNTYAEAAEEFGLSEGHIKRCINEDLPRQNSKIFIVLKNRPYMVFQRCVFRGCSIEEARKTFQVSEQRFNKFMQSILKDSPGRYVYMKSKISKANKK